MKCKLKFSECSFTTLCSESVSVIFLLCQGHNDFPDSFQMWMKSPRDTFNQIRWHLYDSLSWQEKPDFCWISALPQSWTQTQFLGKSDSALFPVLIIVAQKRQQTLQEILLLNRGEDYERSQKHLNPLVIRRFNSCRSVSKGVGLIHKKHSCTSSPEHGWFLSTAPT